MKLAPNDAAEKVRRKVVKYECDTWNTTVPIGANVSCDEHGECWTCTIASPMRMPPDWNALQPIVGINFGEGTNDVLVSIRGLKRAS